LFAWLRHHRTVRYGKRQCNDLHRAPYAASEQPFRDCHGYFGRVARSIGYRNGDRPSHHHFGLANQCFTSRRDDSAVHSYSQQRPDQERGHMDVGAEWSCLCARRVRDIEQRYHQPGHLQRACHGINKRYGGADHVFSDGYDENGDGQSPPHDRHRRDRSRQPEFWPCAREQWHCRSIGDAHQHRKHSAERHEHHGHRRQYRRLFSDQHLRHKRRSCGVLHDHGALRPEDDWRAQRQRVDQRQQSGQSATGELVGIGLYAECCEYAISSLCFSQFWDGRRSQADGTELCRNACDGLA